MIVAALIVLSAFVIFYAIIQADIPGSWKFIAVVLEMLAVSQIFIKRYKMPSELGLVLLKSKEGIAAIDRLARSDGAFNFIADVGATISYGLLSVFLMRRNVSPLTFVIGLALLAFSVVFVAPVALAFLLSVAGLGGVSGSTASAAAGTDIGIFIVAGALLLGGLFLFILGGIVFYGMVILKAIATTIFLGTNAISSTASGGDLLLPGVNLPFFEGIIALAIVMVVHEGSHAVLTRIAKIPLLSSGIVLFGVIPIGAFVEPDEKKLLRADAMKQTRVLVAGPTANLITAALGFIVLMAFFYSTADMRQGAMYILPAPEGEHSALPPGTILYGVNGESVESINFTELALPANTNVSLDTNHGVVARQTNGEGKIGIWMGVIGRDSIYSRYTEPALQFIYIIMGLVVSLNFVVGTVNILPVPLFDGYRILDVNVKNKMIVKAISYTALFFFVLNFLPRFFH
ncbi:MAG TPA: site-2 protease family protein [Candidatus Bilamarchaeum sp.]|nr:site-2 protease family protein [Candidatus Bilamarchaeum sp.]